MIPLSMSMMEIKTAMLVLLCNLKSVIPSSVNCLNDHSFLYNGTVTTCQWVRWKEGRRQHLCRVQSIRDHCPQSCGLCCEDDDTYKFRDKSSMMRNCSWIATTSELQYCNQFKNSRMIRDACPFTCDFYKSEVPLNQEINGYTKDSDDDTIQKKRNSELILGTVLSFISALALIVLYKNLKKRDHTMKKEATTLQKRQALSSDSSFRKIDEGNHQDLESSCKRKTPPEGVSVFWIKHNLSKKAQDHEFKVTATLQEIQSLITTLGENSVCPRDGKLGAAIVDYLEGEDYVGPANVMLSCHKDNTLGNIIDTLSDYCLCNDLDPRRTYVWASFLNNNQH